MGPAGAHHFVCFEVPHWHLWFMQEHPSQSAPCTAFCAEHLTDLLLALQCPPQHLDKLGGQREQHGRWGVTHRSSNSHRQGLLLRGLLLHWSRRLGLGAGANGGAGGPCSSGCGTGRGSASGWSAECRGRSGCGETRPCKELATRGVCSRMCLWCWWQACNSVVLQGPASTAANSNNPR